MATPDTVDLGQPGLDHGFGSINEEKHPALRGQLAMRIYEEMESNDPTIGAGLYSIEGFLRRIVWRLKPADDSVPALEWATFVRSCMDDMDRPWSDFVADVVKMLTYGYSLHEVVYKYRRGPNSKSKRFRSRYTDGRVGWRDLGTRAQKSIDSWVIEEDGTILGANQWAPTSNGPVFLPMDRCVLFRTSAYKNNPEGQSLLRRAYRPWYFKKRLEEIEAIGLSRSLVNLPVVEIPVRCMGPNASPAEKAIRSQAEKMVQLLSKDRLSGVVVPTELDEQGKPTGYKFRLSTASATQLSTDPVIRRYDARILMTLAAEFLILGTEKTGSFALSVTKNENFVRSLDRFADIIADQINQVLIPRLMQVNGVPPELWPTMDHEPIDAVGVAELGLFISQAQNMLTPTVDTENALRRRAQLPPISEEEYAEAEAKREAAEKAKGVPASKPDESGDGADPDPESDDE